MQVDLSRDSRGAVSLGSLADNDPGGVLGEDDRAHLLEGHALGLGQHEVEEQGVGGIAHSKYDEEAPADFLDGDARDLADERVEGEARHGR